MRSRIRRSAVGIGVPAAVIIAALTLTLAVGARASSSPTPLLGTAANFSVLAGSAVTNTGPTVLASELGVSPGTAITGFPPGIAHGATHSADAGASGAQNNLTIAYNDAAADKTTSTVPDVGNIGGETLTAGVYASASSMLVDGTLTLNGAGNPNAVFVFKTGSTVVTGSASKVVLENGAQACNVYWQVGSGVVHPPEDDRIDVDRDGVAGQRPFRVEPGGLDALVDHRDDRCHRRRRPARPKRRGHA